MLHLSVVFIVIDLLWLFFGSADHSETNIYDEPEVQEFWDSIQIAHAITYIWAILEFLLKGALVYFLFMEYKTQNDIKSLINFNYKDEYGSELNPGVA